MPHGTSDRFWERHARRYDRATMLLNRRFPEMASHVAEAVRGRARVLEVAAGTGLVTLPISRVVGHLVATDRSREMLQVLRGRIAAERSNVAVEQADALALPLSDGAMDGVVAANLLHLLPDPARALRELKRVLRVGGVLCVPTFEHAATTVAGLTSWALALAGFPVVTRFRGQMLRSLVEEQGFSVGSEAIFPGVLPLKFIAAARLR